MEKPDIINSLISGAIIFKIGKQNILFKPPSVEDKTFADFFSYEAYEECLFDGVWTNEDVELFLIENGYWSVKEEESIKQLKTNLENMSVDYLNSFYSEQSKEYIRKNIDSLYVKLGALSSRKYLLSDRTCEYVKSYAYASYIASKNCYLDGELCTQYNIHTLVDKISLATNKQSAALRRVSKSNEWRSLWIALKEKVFHNSPSSFTDLQNSLISWSCFYDRIYESMDKPAQEIIEDDIAIDGWYIKEGRKRKEEEKKRLAEEFLPDKMSNAGEIFIPAKNLSDIKNIMNLNDTQGIKKIQSLERDLAKNGTVDESNLTSTKQEVQMAFNNMNSRRK